MQDEGVTVKTKQQRMNSSEIIARELVQAGVQMVTACRGAPGSEVLFQISSFKRSRPEEVYTAWSINEKCAFEVAYGAASLGKKAACFIGKVGINVAFASIMKALEKPIDGGLVIVVCDDPGLQSSDQEQGVGLMAPLFNIPVYVPVSPKEAADATFQALSHSVEHKKPVIVRTLGGVISPDSSAEKVVMDIKAEQGSSGIGTGLPRGISFSTIQSAFPEAFFLGAAYCFPFGTVHEDAHAFLDMGGGVAFAAGLYDAFNQDNKPFQIVVSVESSLFFCTGLTALYDAVQKEKKFILLITDSGGAMKTKTEGTSQTNGSFDSCSQSVRVEGIAKAFGISFVKIIRPNDAPLMIGAMREALEYLKEERSRPAVIIVRQEPVPLRKRN